MSIVWIEPKDSRPKKSPWSFLIPFIAFLAIPLIVDGAILASALLGSPLVMELPRGSFVLSIVLIVTMIFYFPSRRYELVLYFVAVYLSNSLLIIHLNTIKTTIIGFSGNGLFIYLSPWLVFSVLGVAYFPIKLGFDLNTAEHPLDRSEEGLFSNNRIIAALQIHGDLPLTKPRGVLISIYGFLTSLSVLAVLILNWQERN